MYKKIFILTSFLFSITCVFSENLSGQVRNSKNFVHLCKDANYNLSAQRNLLDLGYCHGILEASIGGEYLQYVVTNEKDNKKIKCASIVKASFDSSDAGLRHFLEYFENEKSFIEMGMQSSMVAVFSSKTIFKELCDK
jgi:hypothetical protein